MGDEDYKDLCFLLNSVKSRLKSVVQDVLLAYDALKFNVVCECTYVKPATTEIQQRSFKTKNASILHGSSIDRVVRRMFRKLCREEEEYEAKGSGWTLSSVDGLLLRFSRYRPLRGSTFIPLPREIALKRL